MSMHATPPAASVRLVNVGRVWGQTSALGDISFTVEAGRFCVLLGPSGCGKTTCLRIVAGLDQATSGRVEIGGRDVTMLPPAERGVSMVFQSYALFPHLTVEENILFGLSGGQQQRVALGRAIVAEAPVCLMDEPLSNLDAQLRAEMRREILALQRRLGITMLYVTHDQTEAMGMADQVILLRAGAIEQDAPPADLYAKPATTFAASFIGTPPMNLLRLPGETALAGIRPEAMRLAGTGLAASVVHAEYLGADTVLACDIDGQSVLARLPGRVDLAAGHGVHLTFDTADLHRFDPSTGTRLP